jgi:hypothetical protein
MIMVESYLERRMKEAVSDSKKKQGGSKRNQEWRVSLNSPRRWFVKLSFGIVHWVGKLASGNVRLSDFLNEDSLSF